MKALAGMAFVVLALLYVYERVDIVQVGYHIESLKAKQVQLQRERDELRVKVSTLTAPERVARAAQRLGLEPPKHEQVVLVRVQPDLPAESIAPPTEVRVARHDTLGGRMP
jgi:cell division protein FtsL